MNEDLMDTYEENPAAVIRPFFPKMVAISLALHLAFAIVISGGGAGHPGAPSINYLDLSMTEPAPAAVAPAVPAPMTPPTERTESITEEQNTPAPAPPTESEKLQQQAREAVQSAEAQPDAMQKVSFGLGLLNGHFGTLADGRTLRSDMREYHLLLLRTINENWWRNGITFEGMNSAVATIAVARNGEIINAQIMQSSGNPSSDRMLVKSLRDAGPLPPLPPYYESQIYTAPIRFNPPLSLFGSKSG